VRDTIFVGMDVHKATISVAVAGGARGGEVRHLGNFLNRADHVGKLVQRLSKTGLQPLRFGYEAGPCGYGLHRQIIAELGLLAGPFAIEPRIHIAGRGVRVV
jgi:transposase